MTMLDRETAARLAQEWLDAFNAHRADLVVQHFSEDVTATSPAIRRLRTDSDGRLFGKAAVLAFYEDGLALLPALHFELVEVLVGVDQITILYRNQADTLVAETLSFGADGLVEAVAVTYGEPAR